MKKIIAIVFVLFLVGCVDNEISPPIDPMGCTSDNDCATGGCSGQVCGLKGKVENIITTCEWKEEYRCYELTTCSCINGNCVWKETDEFKKCMGELK